MKEIESRKKGRYFSHILLSYLCFVLISLFSTVLLYQISYRRLIEQTTHSDYAVFEQFYQIMDQELSNASDKTTELGKDYYNMLRWLNEDHAGGISSYSRYMVRQRLKTFSNNSLCDLFIYLPNSNKIISGYYSALSPEDYFFTYYQKQYNYQPLLQANLTRELVSINNTRGQETIALKSIIYSGSYSSSTLFPVVCVLNPNHVLERMNYLEQSTGGNVMIVDSDNQVIVRSSLLSDLDPTGLELPVGTQQMEINGQKYMVFVNASTIVSCKYVSFVPLSTMEQSLSYFQLYSIINIFSLCIFGLLLAFLLTQVNYKPIAHLMESVFSLNDKKPLPGTEEFEYLEDSIKNAITEKIRYTNSLAQFRQVQRYGLISNLTNGIVPANSVSQNLFAEIGEMLISDRFAVMLYTIEEWNDNVFSRDSIDERPMLSRIILPNVIEELCNEKNRGFVINARTDQFTCVVNMADTTTTEDLLAIANKSLNFLTNEMGILCTVGIGNVYTTLKDIRASFNEARRAQEYKVIFGLGEAFCYCSLPVVSASYNFSPDLSTRLVLLQCVKDETMNINQVYDEIFSACFSGHQPGTPEAARSFILDMCVQANSILADLDTQSDRLLSNHQFDLSIETYKTIENFREYFNRRMQDIRQEYLEHHIVKSLGQNILEYIDTHYNDINLGVNEIGSYFDLSPAYCSKIFRQETNQSLLESINNTRIKKSCEQLLNTNDNLDSIAQDCGFTSSTVFIRNFKKVYGVTPGNYRKLMKK